MKTRNTYHIPSKKEDGKTVCGRPIEVAGRPQVLLTNKSEVKKGAVCGRCKALRAMANAKALIPGAKPLPEKTQGMIRTLGEKLRSRAEKKDRKPRTPALLVLGDRMPKTIEVTFKGVEHKATVLEDGRIAMGQGDEPEIYNSPSRAGKAIAGREIDGWRFWSYRKEDGTLEKIDALRKTAA